MVGVQRCEAVACKGHVCCGGFMHARVCLRDLCLAMSTDHLLKPYNSGVRPLSLQDMFVLVWEYFESVPWRMCTIRRVQT